MATDRWLVDGMNVIGSRPDGWWRDRGKAIRRLTEQLERFARAGDREVVVVFDGHPRDVGAQERVEVRFAPGGRDAADRVIAELVAADPAPDTLSVVTSDAALAEEVRAHGGRVVPAGTFRRRLDDEV
jgi:predicted RNA-binding protein with PIN domain